MTKAKLYKEMKKKSVDVLIEELEKRGEVISVLHDRIFRTLFSDEEMRGILAYLIVYIVGMHKDFVFNNIDVVNSYEGVHNIKEREMTHDLKVEVGNNTITLEMNRFNDLENRFRNMAHFHESIVKKLERAKGKNDMGKVIQISFDGKVPYSNNLISKIMMMDIDNHQIDESESNFIKYRINLPKLQKMDYNEDVTKLSRLERILLIMTETKKKELWKLAKGDKELETMVKKIEKMSKDPKMVSYINDENLRKIAYEMDMEESNKKGHESGYSEGHESGYTEGHESGYNEGHEFGYSEGTSKKQIEIAYNMLNKKYKVDEISSITGLSEEEVLKLND